MGAFGCQIIKRIIQYKLTFANIFNQMLNCSVRLSNFWFFVDYVIESPWWTFIKNSLNLWLTGAAEVLPYSQTWLISVMILLFSYFWLDLSVPNFGPLHQNFILFFPLYSLGADSLWAIPDALVLLTPHLLNIIQQEFGFTILQGHPTIE